MNFNYKRNLVSRSTLASSFTGSIYTFKYSHLVEPGVEGQKLPHTAHGKFNDRYVDYGASNHMTSHGEWFRDAKDLKTPGFVETGDDTTHPITQISKVPLSMEDGQTKYLKDVLHVPTITKNWSS